MKTYSSMRRPFLRVFLAAMFTYQLCYWSWEKMRTDEVVEGRTGESESPSLESNVTASLRACVMIQGDRC